MDVPRPGGAEAATSHRERPRSLRAVPVVALILGFLLAVAWAEARDAERSARPGRERLAALAAARQAQTRTLEGRLADLRARLSTAAGRGRTLADVRAGVDRLAAAAGRAPLTGPGVVVELRDSSLAAERETSSIDERVQDIDLQLVVNALWAAGAEAVAINGERLVSTTAIRSAGGAILVNFRVLTSPYRVVAIGDATTLARRFRASDIAVRFGRWADLYGLGMSVKTERRVRVPAFAGAVRSRYAAPAAD